MSENEQLAGAYELRMSAGEQVAALRRSRR